MRNQVEDIITCMKRDGTVARLSELWFGNAPGPDQAERIEFPGYGPPDMPGFDPTPQNPTCG
jgi:polar amino acid transport system substrate-binding protein